MLPAAIKMEESITIEQKLNQIGEFIQGLSSTEEEYQELMFALYQQMLKVFMPDEQPINPPIQMEFKKTKKTKEKYDYSLFLQKVTPNESHSIEELTQLYNDTFKTEITTRGFGKLKETKEFFYPTKSFKNGKYITTYVAKK